MAGRLKRKEFLSANGGMAAATDKQQQY